jgi:hypothetical protein
MDLGRANPRGRHCGLIERLIATANGRVLLPF